MAAKFVVEDGSGAPVITAGAFVIGITYEILTAGTTDFTAIGSADNDVGTEFVATGAGTGDGTATTITPTNSYLSIADADQYHDNVGTAAASWDSLTDSVKEQALRDGTRYLDGHYARRWKGARTTSTNALDWPRQGVVDGDGFSVDKDDLPVGLEDATAEAALRSTSVELTPDLENEGVITLKREKADGVGEEETQYDGGFNQYTTFTEIDELLHDLIKSGARVTR